MSQPDGAPVTVSERAVLAKFEGDDTDGTPVEVIVIEDSTVTDRWQQGDDRPCPT